MELVKTTTEAKTPAETFPVRLSGRLLLISPSNFENQMNSESGKPTPPVGVVAAAGPGALTDKGQRIPICAKAGERISWNPKSGVGVSVNGQDYVLISEGDILWVWN